MAPPPDPREGPSSPGTLIFETVHGSRAYGLAREGSDLDLKGVHLAPTESLLGFGRPADAPRPHLERGGAGPVAAAARQR